jgi:hypothetical protein
MFEITPPANTVESLQVAIRKCENGYAVDVRYPAHMLMKGMPPQLQAMLGAYQKMGEAGESGDPMRAFAEAMSGFVKKAHEAPPPPLRKPHEEYVFTTLDQMLAFVKELFGAAE